MGQKMEQYSKYAQEATQGLPSNAMPGHTVPSPSVRDPMADGMLVQGEKGDSVKAMQEKLVGLGFTGADGKPLHPDGDFGKNTRHAVEEFQRQHGLQVDGKAGKHTLGALDEAVKAKGQEVAAADRSSIEQPALAKATTLADPSHADHARYAQATEKLEGLEVQRAQAGMAPLFASRKELENAAGQVAFESKVSGMQRIDAIVARPDGAGVFAVQGNLGDPSAQRVYIDRAQAVGQSVEASTQQVNDLNKQFAMEQNTATQAQTQGQVR